MGDRRSAHVVVVTTMPANHRQAFTLVELLVVVTVLALLAAVAAVNYQHAAARSKVARVQADMRTITGALEAYRADEKMYPPSTVPGGDILLEHPLVALTTPVAYVASVPQDPFGLAPYNFEPWLRERGYLYRERAGTSVGMSSETFGHIWRHEPRYEYFIHSCGPNRIWDVLPFVEYDVTNGTVSAGDIVRMGP
jgi:general secretion pathway protein G